MKSLKFNVQKYNDHSWSINVGEFKIMTIDAEWPTSSKRETIRQAHKRIENEIMNGLNGEWLLGELRVRNVHDFYEKSYHNATISACDETDNFIPNKKLICTNGQFVIINHP